MGRHQLPRHLRRRLIAAGTAAVCILGTAVGIGVFGAAQADNEAAQRPVPCLPDVPPPASSETVPPPEESAPPAESAPPGETAPPAESDPASAPPSEPPEPAEPPASDPAESAPPTDPPAEEPPADQAPAEEPTVDQPPAPQGRTAPQGARPPGQRPSEEEPPPAEQPPAEQPPAENPPAEEPPAEEEPPVSTDPNEVPGEQGPPPPDTVPAVPPDAPEDDFGDEECTTELGPFPQDFVNIRRVPVNNLARGPRPTFNGSRGTFVSRCGTNAEGHINPDNFITSPGIVNAAHHDHDYVGNTDANALSTDESLLAADTTCRLGDKSTYFWPVIRVRDAAGGGAPDDANAHNVGTIVRPSGVRLQFRGNARSDVVAMPQFLRVITGNAKAQSQGGTNANAKWTCTGFTNRITDRYPLCPRGSQVQRIADFPSCWDGENTDSANHRDHIVFPDRRGQCPEGTVAVPQLRITLNYSLPRGAVYAVDAFPAELHSPITDHNDFVNVMPTRLMDRVVRCINSGRRC